MNLKLDENLGKIVADTLRKAGHNVSTVADEGLHGSDDRRVIERSRQENRCLVTLDLEFGNPLIFRPSEYSGTVQRGRTRRTSLRSRQGHSAPGGRSYEQDKRVRETSLG